MRTIELKVYSFDELSDEAKEKAINKERECNYKYGIPWQAEINDSFEKFADIFGINWNQIDYEEPHRNDYRFTFDDNIMNLSGQRLATYIWNNYKRDLFKKKYLKSFDGHKKHRNIVNHTSKDGSRKWCNYYSGLQMDNSCVLTGVCYDHSILNPIYEFLDAPKDNIDFETLLNDCIYSLCHDVQAEIEYQNSDEAIKETIDANGYKFDEDGNMI